MGGIDGEYISNIPHCPYCEREMELVDDSGRMDGMQPDAWCTWFCGACRWEAGWAKNPELADRTAERRILLAKKNLEG